MPHEPAGLEHIDSVPVSRCPQVLVAELHRRALVEYVRPLLRGRLRCRSARTRSRVAGRLREDAAQLQRLFRRLVSARLGWENLRRGVGVGLLGSQSRMRGGSGKGTLNRNRVHDGAYLPPSIREAETGGLQIYGQKNTPKRGGGAETGEMV